MNWTVHFMRSLFCDMKIYITFFKRSSKNQIEIAGAHHSGAPEDRSFGGHIHIVVFFPN